MLGRYLGYITHSGQTGRLSEEVEYAKAYGEIQQLRFANRVDFSFGEMPTDMPENQIPRLILQPLIENACEHGVGQLLQGGIIRVSFHRMGRDALDICVEDNGQALTEARIGELQDMLRNPSGSDPMESIALVNIQRRLMLFYHNESCLTVGRSELGGLACRLHLHGGDRNDTNPDG